MMHFIHNVLTNSPNQYSTPSTHHLHAGLKLTTLPHQSPLCTDQKILNPKIFNNYPFLTHIYMTYIILTKIIISIVMK